MNATSISDLFGERYGPSLQGLSGIFFILFQLTVTVAPFLAAGKIFAVGLILPEFWTMLLLFAGVLIVSYVGGLPVIPRPAINGIGIAEKAGNPFVDFKRA